jgi:predicted RNA-binding Zn-ribbon protein involved in translation (DUF1610 family)
LGGWIIGVITAYNQCKKYNNQLEIIAYNRINEINSMEYYDDSMNHQEESMEHHEDSLQHHEEQVLFQCENCGSRSITVINGIPTCESCGTKYPQKRK